MERTNIYLDAQQRELLDRLARTEGVSRAEVIRRLLDRALAGADDRSVEADLHVIDASFGVASELPEPERGDDARSRHLAEIWSRSGR